MTPRLRARFDAFLDGLASLLDLCPTAHDAPSGYPHANEVAALRSDWERLGFLPEAMPGRDADPADTRKSRAP
jgi:hypothetical protein